MIAEDYKRFNKILQPYIGEQLVIGKKYLSPIPRGTHYETTASFYVFEGQESFAGKLYWKDWGITQKGSRPEHLVMHLHNVDYPAAKLLLQETLPEIGIKRQERYNLEIEDRPNLTKEELAFWEQFYVSEKTLRKYKVYGVNGLYCQRKWGKDYLYRYDPLFPAFSYREREKAQFYRPCPKKFWRIGTFIGGWEQLPYVGQDVVLVSGAKDGLSLYEATGLPFLWGSGEGAWKQYKPKMKELRRRFKNVWTLFDPDIPGRMATDIFREEISVPPFPFGYPDLRDIAELTKNMGQDWIKGSIFDALNK